jgi:hypothetical protein
MLNSKPFQKLLILCIVFLLNTELGNAQCNLFVNYQNNPSSCTATDGSITISSRGTCNRNVKIYKGSTLLSEGTNSLTQINLSKGVYRLVAERGCGCDDEITRYIHLVAADETILLPQVNGIPSDNITVCRGSSIRLGVQNLGITNLHLSGPGGYSDSSPDGNTFWNLSDLQPSNSGLYTIQFTNSRGCTSITTIRLNVGNLSINAGSDVEICKGASTTLNANATGRSVCKQECPKTLDSLLVRWTLDQCDASNQNNKEDFTEFIPNYPSKGNCTGIFATNIFKPVGDHSCTPIPNSYSGDVGMCVMAEESCDTSVYDSNKAIKFEVTVNPTEGGRITGLSFVEQSPINWITTNGASGVNNFNTKYLLKVYKNNILIYSKTEIPTERVWNTEIFDFKDIPAFYTTETAVYRFELRGYCVTERGGGMAGWEVDDIRVFGGCCTGLSTSDSISYLWSTGATSQSISVTPDVTTAYTVMVTDCAGCTRMDTVNVTVNPLPNIAISGIKNICIGGSTVLTASGGAQYLWSTGSTSSSITVSPALTTKYHVTVTSNKGCRSIDSVSVVVHNLPSPVISGDLEICKGDSTLLTASGGVSFEWSTGATTNSIVVKPITGTEYRVMAIDENGCMEYSTVLVIVYERPSPNIEGDTLICAGESTTLTASGGASYIWSNGLSTASINISPTANSIYTVTVTNNFGCTSTKSKEIIVHPLPVVIISGNSTLCNGKSSVITASGGVSYRWSTGATTASITINPGLNTNYTVTVTNVHGCTATASRMASVMSLPVATISGPKKICEGTSVTLLASGGVLYFWSTGQNTPSINITPSLTTIYRVTVTDANGCTSSASHRVKVNTKPSVDITGKSRFCIGDSTVLTANVTGKTSCDKDCKDSLLLRWTLDQCNAEGLANQLNYSEFLPSNISVGGLISVEGTNVFRNRGDHSCTPDGTGGIGICFGVLESCDPNQYNPQNALRFSVTLNPKKTGRLTKLSFREQSPLNWVTTNGASGINNYNQKYLIRVYKNGTLIYSENEIGTERDWNVETFDFSDHPDFTVTESCEFSFELYGYCMVDRGGIPGWEIDDIRVFGGDCPESETAENAIYLWSNGATTPSIKVIPTISTTYTVTVTDCNGCTSTDSKLVQVDPLPTIEISNNGPLTCAKTSVTLTATGGGSYEWSGGGTSSTKVVTTPGTYTVTVTSANGCTSTSSTIVNQDITPPTATTSNDGPLTCAKPSVTLTATGGGSYEWSGGGTSSTKVVTTPGTYTVTVTAANGCSSTSSTIVNQDITSPTVTTSNDGPLTCSKTSVTLTATGGGIYQWSGGGTSSTKVVTTPGTYTVTVTSANGCTSTSSTIVNQDITPPTVTTSNDGPLTCAKTSVTLTATGGGSYEWSGGGTASTKVVTTPGTYTVTVTSANGCTSTSSTIVTQDITPPTGTTSNDGPLTCSKTSVTLTATGGGSYEWSGGGTSSTKVVTTPGTYTVTVTSANGCTSTSSTIVNQDITPPTATTSNDGPLTCAKPSVTLTATGGGSYEWSGGGTSSTKVVTTPGTYTVTVTAANGCSSTSSTIVNQDITSPTVTTSNDGPLTCSKTSVTLTATGGGIYQWSGGGTSSTKVVTTPGTYTVTVTSANGCTSTSSTIVNQDITPPTVTTSNDGPLTCAKTSVTLTATGGGSYQWSGGGTSSTKVVTTPGTYTVTVTAANGCTSTSSTIVTQDITPPTVTTSNDGPLTCSKTSVTLTATGGGSYQWSGEGTSSTKVVTTPGTYTVTVTSANGCTSTSSTIVNQDITPPTVTTSNDGPLTCAKTSVTLTATGGGSYEWSGGGTSSTKVVTTPGTYTVTVTSANGCTSTSSTIVNQDITPPTVTTSNDGPLTCAKPSVTLTATGGGSYEWSGGGTSSTKVVTTPGTYTVTVTAANGCSSTSSTIVNQDITSPTVTTSNDGPLTCTKTSVTLTATGGGIYQWSGGGTSSTKVVTTPGTYTVTVTSANGCTSTSSTIVNQDITSPTVTTSNDGPLTCAKTSVTLTATGSGSYQWSGGGTSSTKVVTTPGTYTVTVTAANGCTSTSSTIVNQDITSPTVTTSNDGPLTCAKTSVTLAATGSGIYQWSGGGTSSTKVVTTPGTYTVTVTSANGCTSTSSTIVNQDITQPTVTTSNDGPLTCAKTSVTLTATGGGSYQWSGGGTSSTKVVTTPGTYTVTVTAANGCSSTSSTIVNQDITSPTVTTSNDGPLTCSKTSVTLTATGGGSYQWSGGGTASTKVVTTPGTYTVTVTSANGCTSTQSTIVTQDITPPTVTTSNDGPLTCAKTSVTLTSTGGGSYQWSGGGTSSTKVVTTPGTYTVTVTSANGCTSTSSSLVLEDKTLPSATINGKTSFCLGDSTVLTASGGGTYTWNTGESTTSIKVKPITTSNYTVTVTSPNGCQSSASVSVIVHPLPNITISGNLEICKDECTTLTASGGTEYLWEGALANGFKCNGSFFVGGLQGGSIPNLYNVSSSGELNLLGSLNTNNINGVGYYCQRNVPHLYGIKMKGNTIEDAVKGSLVVIDPRTANTTILGEIPQPPNIYGSVGRTGIMTYIGDIGKDGKFYFPAVATYINPATLRIIDYTMYLGVIDLNDHGSGSNVVYKPITISPNCKPYMDACIEGFQAFALNPASREPAGGIHDWALSPDGNTLYSFMGIENAMFRLDINTLITSCVSGPSSNNPYIGQTGIKTDEFGGIYYENNVLKGLQVDRGRLFNINQITGELTLISEGLPQDFRGDNANCYECGVIPTGPLNSASITVCPISTTTYRVSVTDINGCKNSASITVVVSEKPIATLSSDGPLTCAKTSVTLTASGGGSYAWSGGGASAEKVVTSAGAYTVTVTASNGCTSTASITVNEDKSRPSVTTNNDGPLTCFKKNVTLVALSVGTTYVWSDGGNASTKVVTTPGTYTVTVTSANGCTSTSSTIVNQDITSPTVTTSNDGPLTCSKTSVTLTATGGGSYQWSGEGTSSTKVVTTPGTYTVTVTSANGCTSTSSTIVNQDITPPTVTTSNDGPLTCAKTSVTLTATGGGSYQWSGGGTASTKVVTTPGTYTVTVTAANGCTSTSSTIVTQDITPPTVTTSNDGPLTCSKTSVTLTATGGGSYQWSGEGTSSTKVVTTPGTYTVTVTSANGCTSTSSTIVNQDITPPTVTTSNDGPLTCAKTSVTLTATGGGSYQWSGGGTSSTKVVTTPGTYTVTVTAANGCTSTSSTIVNQDITLPTVTTSNDGPLTCSKTSVTLTATGGGSYLWSVGGTAFTKIVTTPGTYTVTVTAANGCSSTSSTIVNQDITPPTVTTSNDGPLTCAKTSVTLTATGGGNYEWSGSGTSSTKVVTTPGTYTVTVTAANGCIGTSSTIVNQDITPPTVTTSNDGPLTCAKPSVTLTATGGGGYVWSGGGTASSKVVSTAGTYTVTVTSSNGCTSTSQTTVTEVITRPTVTTSNDGPMTCLKSSVTLTATGGGSYAWSGGGNEPTKVVTIPGTYTVTVTSANGCTSTSSTIVTQDITPPTVTTSNDGPLTCAKTSVTLTATGGGSYAWSGGGNVATKVVSEAGFYIVTVTSANGCTSTSSVTILVDTIRPVVNILNGGILTCGNTSITLTASGGGAYLWSTGETTSVKIASVSGNYTVTVTGTNGCSSSGNTSVEQNITPPVAAASNDGPLTCLKTSVTLTATGGGLYTWSGGGTSATKIVTVAGTYTVTVTAPNRCTSTATTIVLQNTIPPVVSISGIKKICEGGSTTLTASGGISYSWSNGQTTAAISVSPVINTLYTVTVTNAVGCTAVAVDSVMIKNKPDVVFSGVNTICVGDSATIVVTGKTDNECPGVCNVTQPAVLALWNLNACHSIMSSGTHLDYSEFIPIVSTSNCNNVTAGNVHRLPGNKHSCTPSPNGSIGMCIGTQNTCNPSKVDFTQALRFEVRLTPTQAGQITGLEFFEQSPENYIWVDGPTGRNNFAQKYILRVSKNGKFIYYKDNISTSRNWTLQNFDFSDNDNFRTLIPATYLFELVPYCTINNGAAESIWDIDEIKVLGGCCNGTTTEIASYRWSDNSTGTSITVKPTVNSTYTVTVTDCCGCTNTKQVNVNVTNLIADLGEDRMISMGQTVTLTPVITGRSICDPNNPEKNVVKYLWSTGATTSSITVTPGSSTFYRVTVTDCNECTDTESISIHVMMPRPLVVYPNPAYNKVNLASESEIDPGIKVRIISSDGKTVISDKPEIIFNTPSNISILIPENVRDGLYYMEISNGQNKYVEKLILIER